MTNKEIQDAAIQYEILRDKRDQTMRELNDLNLVLNKLKPVLMRGARQATKVGRLNRRHLAVLDLRVRKGMTLEDVGKEFDVTRERVRQIECKILELLQQLNQVDKSC